jgi:ABC-type nickel/cobalt efflux system permease component RcnA
MQGQAATVLAVTAHANRAFYEAAAQVIPVLLLAAAVGESRIKVRRQVTARSAIGFIFLIAGAICAGELAALRALATGDDSQVLLALAALSLGLGLGLVVQYLGLAAYRDIAGDDAKPTQQVIDMLSVGSMLISVAVILVVLIPEIPTAEPAYEP